MNKEKLDNTHEIYEKLVKEKIESGDGPFEFNGWNCHDLDESWNDGIPCDGWDGVSRRCNCGNRRVDWILSDCATYVYAEAY